jgi:drug/metabolite transporter (DMT)-like permease
MSLPIIAIILSAALLHAVWNAIVKTATDRTTTLGLVAFGHVLPGAVMVVLLPLPSAESFIYIALSTLVHFAYFYLLGRAYQHGDLSVVYPIARGVVPVLLSIWAWLFLGEVLSFGVGRWTLLLSLATGFCISIYSLVDGVGVRLSGNTVSYWAWGAFLHIFIAGFAGWRRRTTLMRLPVQVWVLGIAGGMVSMTAYGLVLYAKNFAPLGAVSALRETSVIFATLIGYFVLREVSYFGRFCSVILMFFGIVFIGLSG